MFLRVEIQGDQIVGLNTFEAMRKTKEKPLVYAIGRSDGAFLARLSLFHDQPNSADMDLLMRLAQRFLQILSNDPALFKKYDRFMDFTELSYEEAEKIGEQLDDKVHSSFLYPENLINLYYDFADDLIRYANRSKYKGILSLLRNENSTLISRQIYFFLADQKGNEEYPFAFAALMPVFEKGQTQWYSMVKALSKIRGAHGKEMLNESLKKASEKSPFLKRLMQTRLIFHPIQLKDEEAFQFFNDIEIFEEAGIVCMLPDWMKNRSLKLTFSYKTSSGLINSEAINKYMPQMLYHGEPISEEEAEELLKSSEGMVRLNGNWIRADHNQIKALLARFKKAKEADRSLMSLVQMRSESLMDEELPEIELDYEDWIKDHYHLSNEVKENSIPPAFNTILRPYQKQAFKWMDTMRQHNLGVVLADDMGLGKTVEVLSMLEVMRNEGLNKILIVVPATLISNWQSEIRKFSPWMSVRVLDNKNDPPAGKTEAFINLITYQKCLKSEYVESIHWDGIILDEAQAIKNASAGQTKKVKRLQASFKMALTGTPIENDLIELWSIFDFINPGFLGTKDEFSVFKGSDEESRKLLKTIIQPFVLRRMKTDKSVISDLPEKNEIDVTINLTKEQIVLYRNQVKELNAKMAQTEPGKRKFLILAAITKLKQICNHPAQFHKSPDYSLSKSGKFMELKNIAETIYENKESVIVFTQFAQIIPALDALLEKVFKKKGGTIDGSTPMNKRKETVEKFQSHELPYLVLSLKTAGVGLNLTEAHNVIHFDRWWNPAVENQASDRAYRIGQRNDVTIYKFVTANTIEEVISSMIRQKQDLADQVINSLDSETLNALSAEELLSAIRWRG